MELQTIGSQNSERGNAVDLVSFSFLLCSLLSFTPSTLRSFSLSRFTIIFLVVPYTSEKGGHITRRVRFYLCILALYGNGKHYSFFARFGTTNASFPVLFSLYRWCGSQIMPSICIRTTPSRKGAPFGAAVARSSKRPLHKARGRRLDYNIYDTIFIGRVQPQQARL